MTVGSSIVLLLLVMDPIGNIPFFLSALANVDPSRQTKVAARELLIAYGVMVIFLFAGKSMMQLLQISESALTIAGGVVLFLIALRMVFPSHDKSLQEDFDGEPFIVPLAIPYVAGPSVLATQLLFMSREPARWPEWWLALTVAWFITAVLVLLAGTLRKYLGQRGLVALERLMGMILVAIAVQMLLSGIDKHLGRPLPNGH
jgi:MarC family membrane protein